MLKKIMTIGIVCFMTISLVGCDDKGSDKKDEGQGNQTTETPTKKEFTEAKGIVKYITIEGDKVALPETVGEYVQYLEKIGKVELGDTGKSIEDAPKMEANERASLTSYLKVYTSDKEFQTFGINYVNSTDKKINVADASVTRITLTYDIYSDEKVNPGNQTIKTMVLITTGGEIPIDGKMTSSKIMKMLGNPAQNTDGYLKYVDEVGYTYKFATENVKGILTSVQIDYPK